MNYRLFKKFQRFGIRPVADFETQNYRIMTHLNIGTDLQVSTETAIGFIPCYQLARIINDKF